MMMLHCVEIVSAWRHCQALAGSPVLARASLCVTQRPRHAMTHAHSTRSPAHNRSSVERAR